MNMVTVAGIAILGLSVTVVLRGLRPDFAVFTGLITALILLISTASSIASLARSLSEIAEETGFSVYTTLILKTLGIGLISQVTADTCRDAGASAIASKVEFSGKLLILGLCIPIVKLLLDHITGFLG